MITPANIKVKIAFLFVFITSQAFGQQGGLPFIRNYPTKEYKASQQNWGVTQDRQGVMYFANNNGVLEFDGANWRLFKLPIVRSIAVDSLGTIYVGLDNDFGFLKREKDGNNKFQSLKSQIPEIHRDLTSCWEVFICSEGIIFMTSEKIFVYKHNQISVLPSKIGFHMSFVVLNRFYVREPGKGLFFLQNNSLQFVEGSEIFAEEKIYSMLPFNQNEILLATRTRGVLIFSPYNQNRFRKPEGFQLVDKFLDDNPVYCGTVLNNKRFAFGTLTQGIVVFDSNGKIENLYNKNTGLQDNTIYRLYADQNQQLWAALDNGISLVQHNLPFCNYFEQRGLSGAVMCLESFENRLYVGTSQYLYVQDQNGIFEPIAGTEGQNYHLYKTSGALLLAGYSGLFEIKGKQAIPLKNTPPNTYTVFCAIENKPDYLFTCGLDGLYLLEKKNSEWGVKHKIKGFEKTAYKVVEDKEENIWVSTNVELYKLKLNSTLDSVIFQKQYSADNGLPSNYAMPGKLFSGELIFSTEKGVFIYLADKERFVTHPDFGLLKGKLFTFKQEADRNVWFEQLLENGNCERGYLKFEAGKYILNNKPFYKFNDIGSSECYFNICSVSESNIFIGTSAGLLQFLPASRIDYIQPFHTLIRQVTAKDSSLFIGTAINHKDFNNNKSVEVPFSHNDIVFHFTATFFEDAEKNVFSYRLIGADTVWSAWVSDFKKEYSNLSPGDYIFEVRSKNQYQVIGNSAYFNFSILPPWYRTWWAYIFYFLLSQVIIWVIVKFNTYRLLMQKKHLEQVVDERTALVVGQKKVIEKHVEELNRTNNKLIETNEELNQTNEELKTTLEIVHSQKKQIEIAHSDITDSIYYAKKIQQAVFPSFDKMQELLSEHFVYFKPRNVVSGDFYWVKRIKQYTIVATADCTGHGVPGAFMSMLGIGLLNEIVPEKEITTTGEVLNRLRSEIKKILNQEGKTTEQKDGMDIALYVIDSEKMELQYAGAYNPLYLIRSIDRPSEMEEYKHHNFIETESAILIEIKADRQPIAIHMKEKPFTTHTLKLKKNDVIYTFSDGFVDQTGGERGFKYRHKNFKSLLLRIHQKSMAEQRDILDKTIENWKNYENQVDDMLVIGVRI